MVLDHFWKALFVVLILVLGYFWWDKRREANLYEVKATQLGILLDPDLHHSRSDPARFEAAYLQAVAFLEKEERAGVDTEALLEAATARHGLDRRHVQYIADGFMNAMETCREFGVFDPAGRNLARMEAGRNPTIEEGPFDGHELVVAPIVSPVLLPDAANDFANAALAPMPVRALEDDVLTSRTYEYLLRLESAGVVSAADATKAKELYRTARDDG